MGRTQRIGLLFILYGLTSGLVTLIGIGPEIGTIDASQSELAAVFIFIISLEFVVTGWVWFRDPSEYPGVPALILGAVGVTGVVGGLVVFRPWQYSGLAGGLRTVITVVFVVVGGGLLLSGGYWFRQREYRYPLALLAGLLSIGVFYLAHQRLDFLIGIPVLTLIIGVICIGPTFAVLYGLKPPSVE